MFRKINSKERVVGFYSTGPQIRPADLRIYDIVERFLPDSSMTPAVFCIIDIRPDRQDLPVTAYRVVEVVTAAGGSSSSTSSGHSSMVTRSFAHVPVKMGAMEAEEIGVEHLLRDINDPTISTVASLIKGKVAGMSTLAEKLLEFQDYLQAVVSGEIKKANPEIIANLQTIINLLPNLNTEHLIRSLIIKTNDLYMAIYLASLIRSVIALHDLVNNKIRYGEDGTEYQQQQQDEEKKDDDKKSEDAKRTSTEKKDDSKKK
jgi:26S proteasome regulatory subunit N8